MPDDAPPFAVFVAAWNLDQGLATPRLHVEMADWLDARVAAGDRGAVLLAFRGAGKSTLTGLLAAWLLACAPDRRILVLAADLALARKMTRNVRRLVERHPLTGHLKPTRPEQWAADRFTVARPATLRDPSVLASGIGGNVTGSRAEFVICDDVEVPATSETAAKRADLRARLAEIDYVLTPGGTQLYVGTPHAYHSIYAAAPRAEAGEERPFLDGFARLEMPLLDPLGRPAWPERFPPEGIEAIRRRTAPNKFAAQMLLRPVDVAAGRLDPGRLRRYDAELSHIEANGQATLTLAGRRLVAAACRWDPAFGAPGAGHASVLAAVFTDEDGLYWLHRVAYLTHEPALADRVDAARQMCLQVAAFARALHLPQVTVETNGLGRFLPGLLRNVLAGEGAGAAVVEDASRRPKDLRIVEAFDAVLAAGALHAHDSVWRTPFVEEMREWRPGAGGRDDGLDAVAGCLLAQPVRLPRLPRRPRTDWRPPGAVRAPTRFEV